MSNNIYIIGFMGTGKTTVGALLSKSLNASFVDTDKLIEESMAMPVYKIFEVYGEEFFRQLEHNALQALATKKGLVVSTGGGIVTHPGNMAIMRKSGIIVCLEASVDTTMKNIGKGEGRPLINSEDIRRSIEELMEKRSYLYHKADIIVRIDDKQPQAVSDEIIAFLKQKGALNGTYR